MYSFSLYAFKERSDAEVYTELVEVRKRVKNRISYKTSYIKETASLRDYD